MTKPEPPRFPAMDTTYQLRIHVQQNIRLRVGALGSWDFPAGNYLYTGSARCNLAARLRRHLGRNKKLRWHIDYLLAHSKVRVVGVVTSTREECEWNRAAGGSTPAPGFGASDCRAGCGAHLVYLGWSAFP